MHCMIRLASNNNFTSTCEPTMDAAEQSENSCCENLSSQQLTFLEKAKQSVTLYEQDKENAKENWRQACASLDLTAELDALQKTPLAFWQVYELVHYLGEEDLFRIIVDKNPLSGMLLGAAAVTLDDVVVGHFVDSLVAEGADCVPFQLVTATLFFHAHKLVSVQDPKLLTHIFRHLDTDERLVDFVYELINFVSRNSTGTDDELFCSVQQATQAICEQTADEQWTILMNRFIEDATNPKSSQGNPLWYIGPAMATTKRASDIIKWCHALDTNDIYVCNLVQSVVSNAMRMDGIKAEELIQALANQGKLTYLLVLRFITTNRIKVCLLVFKHLPAGDFKQFASLIAGLSRNSRLALKAQQGGVGSSTETAEHIAKRYSLFVSLMESMSVPNFVLLLKVLNPSIEESKRLYRELENYKDGFRGLWPNQDLADKLYYLWMRQMQLGSRISTYEETYKLICALKLHTYDQAAGILANQIIMSREGVEWRTTMVNPCMQEDPCLLGLAAADTTYQQLKKRELLELPQDKLVMVLPFMVGDFSNEALLEITDQNGLGIWQEALLYFLSPKQKAAIDQHAITKINEPDAKAYFEIRRRYAQRLDMPVSEIAIDALKNSEGDGALEDAWR